MTTFLDPVELTSRLIACPSVTPQEAGTLDVLEEALRPLGFEVHRFTRGEAPDGPVENLFATRGDGGRHFAFAGHVDVVPPGPGWLSDPFTPTIKGQLLYGRGAVDMKGAIGAFVAACSEGLPDEEGPARFGTVALIDWMEERGIRPDMILVGEPTSEAQLGDTVKIGRRGSVNIWITVPGIQGHVAYPHKADNPITKLGPLLTALDAMELDAGTGWFPPSNLEVTDIEVANTAHNVIPGSARIRLNIRFSDHHRGADLIARVEALAEHLVPGSKVEGIVSGEAYLSPPGPLSDLVAAAIKEETGVTPTLSTSGGTSDSRFLCKLCPVIDFGLVNATMHKLDEAVAVEDLRKLTAIYRRIIASALA
jgi:succinyl-diaminopimelate desuccinylase